MLKTLFVILGLLNGTTALASKATVLNQGQFLADVQREIGDSYRNADISIGGFSSCDVVISETNGPRGYRVNVSIASKGKEIVKVIVDPEDKVKVSEKVASDGSYSKIYQFKFGSTLTKIHVDDAYDAVELDSGAGRLTCGVYY